MTVEVTVSGGSAVAVNVTGGVGPAAVVGTNVYGVQQFKAGTNITVSTAAGSITINGPTIPVESVAGRTGVITLSRADISGLSDVAGSGSYTSLANIPVSFAPSVHTHSTADIVSFASAVSAIASPLASSAASSAASVAVAAGTTAISSIASSIAAVAVASGTTAIASIALPIAQAEVAAGMTAVFGIASSAATNVIRVQRLNLLTGDVSLLAGTNVAVSSDTAANTITIASAGGGGGPVASNLTPLANAPTGSSGTSLEVSRADHVHPASGGGGFAASIIFGG
jgi:hypothetical protein